MNISDICIKRPVLATVLSLILIVVGLAGFCYINTRFEPKFENDSIFIYAHYPGASAKLMETNITTPLEEAISGVEGIDSTNSTSQQERTQITVNLDPGFDAETVANKIRNNIAMDSYMLPSTIKSPTVMTGYQGGDLIDFGFVDKTQTVESITDFLNRYVKDHLEQLPGVSEVDIYGGNPYAMRVWLNPQKMAARNIGVNDVETAIQNSNLQLPAGKLHTDEFLYPITATTKLSTVTEFANIPIRSVDHKIIRLKDIAKIKLGPDNSPVNIIDVNGKPGVIATIYNSDDSNPMQTADEAKRYIQQLKGQLPSSMQVSTLFDRSLFMHGSIHEVYLSIALAILCVGMIIFIFLGRLRSVIVPLVTIPICVIATFGLMYCFGFTINIITLIAVVLSVGLVVDDAIVMLENIHRHIEQGEKPLLAAIKGSKEITFSVIAMTITLAAVYAPIGLIHGNFSALFRPFALTLAGAVLISGFVALTLSPMMCSRLLQAEQTQRHDYHYHVERLLERITQGYKQLLELILQHRLWIILIVAAIAASGFFLFKSLAFNLVPSEDLGLAIVSMNAPVGSSAPYNNAELNKAYQLLTPYFNVIQSTFTFASESSSFNASNSMIIDLKPYDQRKMSATQLANAINQSLAKHPELNANAIAISPSSGGDMQHDLEFYVMQSGSYMQLYHTTQALVSALHHYHGLSYVNTDMKFDSQQYNINVNRDMAAALNVGVSDIDNSIANFWGGMPVSSFNLGGRIYDVITQAQQPYLSRLDALDNFFVKNTDGKLIPLSNLVSIKPILTQSQLYHYNRLRAAMITANVAPGYNLGDVIQHLNIALPHLLPSDAKFAFTGLAKQIIDNSNNMGLMLLLAFVFIYLVLSAQFESFIDPFIILLAVPLSIVSALAALRLTGGSLNVFTIIGLVTLIGLIAKHGILITQFANKLQQQGLVARDALIEAASIRLRPILMTTAAMVFGALPLVLASGAGSHSRHELGTVIIAGLLFGTFFSLVVVPITYSYVHRIRR